MQIKENFLVYQVTLGFFNRFNGLIFNLISYMQQRTNNDSFLFLLSLYFLRSFNIRKLLQLQFCDASLKTL